MRTVCASAARTAMFFLSAALLVPHTAHAQAGSLKVLDWNTHHGVGTDGAYDLQRFVTWIQRSGANVVSLNEVEKFTGWGNEDQPARYAALLEASTGKTWYYTFAEREGGDNGQGNLILSTFPIVERSSLRLSHSRSVARAQIVVNGSRVNVFSTHLDADSGSRRAMQMNELRRWAARFGQQHVFAGDFNAWPGAPEIDNMSAFAYDAWRTAAQRGTAVAHSGNEAGTTRKSRIDYIWQAKNATSLVLESARVFDTRERDGVMPSDHRPVMATFRVAGTSRPAGVRFSASTNTPSDFDGDGRSDPTVYRPATGDWFAHSSSGVLQVAWGAPALGDIPVAGDYDGDARTDVAVFRPGDGTWHVRYARTGASANVQWGAWSDLPVPADYDGDGRTDIAVFRPANGVWYVRYSSTGATTGVQWGTLGDIPVTGDYDADGKSDLAVFRPSNGTWYVILSSTGGMAACQWGTAGDITAPGDYDGDGGTDIAVFRPSDGMWYVRSSSTGATFGVQWGQVGDKPITGDYDGDGTTDVAVHRPSDGVWYVRHSSNGAISGIQWGTGLDIPILERQ